MQYVVIALADNAMKAAVADGAKQALDLASRYLSAGYERVRFTDGKRLFTLQQIEALVDA